MMRRRQIAVSAGMFAALCLGVPVHPRAQSLPPVVPKAEEVYHNVRYLKGIPYDQFVPTMYMFAESLGVECDYCHEPNRELDGKATKRVAGQMFEMVRQLNRESFGGGTTITCYTCHRGSPRPVNGPTLSGEKPKNHTASAGKLPTADDVIGKYLAALGGEAALRKIATRIEIGTLMQNYPGGSHAKLPVEAISERPGKRITKGFSVTHLGDSPEGYGVYNGDYGWVREGKGPVREMWHSRVDAAKLEDTLNFPSRLKYVISDLKPEAPEEVEGQQAYILSGRMPALPSVKLYFDAESGLLVRVLYATDSAVGPVPTQIDYADYRDVDGIKIPFRWNVALVRGVRVTYQLDEVRQNVTVDQSLFEHPDPPPPLY